MQAKIWCINSCALIKRRFQFKVYCRDYAIRRSYIHCGTAVQEAGGHALHCERHTSLPDNMHGYRCVSCLQMRMVFEMVILALAEAHPSVFANMIPASVHLMSQKPYPPYLPTLRMLLKIEGGAAVSLRKCDLSKPYH